MLRRASLCSHAFATPQPRWSGSAEQILRVQPSSLGFVPGCVSRHVGHLLQNRPSAPTPQRAAHLHAVKRLDSTGDRAGGGGRQSAGGGRGGGGVGRGWVQKPREVGGGWGGSSGSRSVPGGRAPHLKDIGTLSELAAVIHQHVDSWAANKRTSDLRGAFARLGQLGVPERGGDPADRALTVRAFTALAAAYLPLVPELREAYLCVNPLWAAAKLGTWGDGRLARELLRRLSASGGPGLLQTAQAKEHANLWWALSRDAPREVVGAAKEVLRESAACLLRMEPKQLNGQDCANVLIACARLRWYKDPDLVHHLTACLVGMQDALCQHLANALYSLGELAEDCGHQPRRQDLEGLAKRVIARLGEQRLQDSFNPQSLSNILLGCAKLAYEEPELLQPLATAAGQVAYRSSSQAFANSLYALAKLGCRGAAYHHAVQRMCTGVVDLLGKAPKSFEPQGLANLLWALEKIQPEGSQQCARALLEECVERRFTDFTPQNLSNTLLALEGLRPEGFGDYALAVAAECRRQDFANFKPQDFSNSVWALAKLDSALAETTKRTPDQSWYAAAVQAASQQDVIKGFKPQEWSNLLYGLALVRHRPAEGLMRAMAEGGQRGPLGTLRSDASSQDCANLLWALAVLGLGSEQGLVDALAGRLRELLRREPRQLVEQALANSLWALAVMGPEVMAHRHGALVGELLREVARRLSGTAGLQSSFFNAEQLSQLRQVQQELEHAAEAASGDDSSVRDLAAVLAAISPVKDGRPVGDSVTSGLQRQVAASLKRLQQTLVGGDSAPTAITSVHQECEVEELGCRVDVLVELAGGRRVAVEVDGPMHFLANPPHTRVRDGPTQLRDRQLERVFGAGNVVSVPYREWDKLRVEAERQRYLARLLGLE